MLADTWTIPEQQLALLGLSEASEIHIAKHSGKPVLVFSLIESKLVLPAHLKNLKVRNAEESGFDLDTQGNALGGIRSPYVDAPVAVLSGLGQGAGFCDLFGTTRLFDDAGLAALYPDRDAYTTAIDEATDAAVSAGFLLPADARLIKSRARTSDVVPP